MCICRVAFGPCPHPAWVVRASWMLFGYSWLVSRALLGFSFGFLGAVLGTLGTSFGPLGGVLGCLGACLDRLGAILGRLGRLLGLLGPSWAPSRDQLGPFWAPRGESGRPLGPPWRPHGLLRGKLGGVLGASWTVFNAVKTANAFKLKMYIFQ